MAVAPRVPLNQHREESAMTTDRNNDPLNRESFSEDEPATEHIPGRDLSGASYGATEREQTRDLRSTNPTADPDDEGMSDDAADDTTRE
jgi:hypothetical protein